MANQRNKSSFTSRFSLNVAQLVHTADIDYIVAVNRKGLNIGSVWDWNFPPTFSVMFQNEIPIPKIDKAVRVLNSCHALIVRLILSGQIVANHRRAVLQPLSSQVTT